VVRGGELGREAVRISEAPEISRKIEHLFVRGRTNAAEGLFKRFA